MLIVFCLVTAGLILLGWEVVKDRVKQHGLLPVTWRWLTGVPHHGKPAGSGRRFWRRPRHHRTVIRCAETAAAGVLLWGVLYARVATAFTLAAAVLAVAGYGCWRTVVQVRTLRHRITWVNPAHLVAAPLLGLPASTDPASYLEVAPDRSVVCVVLPKDWNGDGPAKARLVSTLTSKLGIEAPEARWVLAGPKPRLEITQSVPPPAFVNLADAMPAIEAAKEDEAVWGLGKKSAPVKTSLSSDSPHIGINAGSGGGKSVMVRSFLAQQLHKGAIALILDGKLISHMWADGLPNVVIMRRPPELHAALLWIVRELDRRNEVALAGADIDGNVRANVGSRLFIVGEELNDTMNKLRKYWREIRAKDDPARSPALDALDSVSFMGRQVLMHILYVGQALSAKAMGGGRDSTENMGTIAFSRTSPRTWKLLKPDFAQPPPDNHVGRLHIVSDRVQTCQGIYMTGSEAREYALSGIVSPLPYGMPGAPRDTAEPVSVLALDPVPDVREPVVSASPVSAPVTLRQAVDAGLLGDLELAGARTARHRDETFPSRIGRDGLAELYDPAALAAWASNRRE